MLPRTQRLNLKRSYRWIRGGKKIEGNLVKLFVRYGENTSALVGVALSKDSFNRAIDRNLAKRKVSASFQDIYNTLPESVNIMAVPKAGVLKASQEEIDKEIKELIKNELSNETNNFKNS